MCDVYMGSWLESLRKNGYVMSFVLNLSMITFSQIKYIKKSWNMMLLDKIKKNSFIILMRIYCGIWNQKKLSYCALMMMTIWLLTFSLPFFLPHLNHIPIINKNLLIHMLIIIFICGAFSLPFFYLILSTSPL